MIRATEADRPKIEAFMVANSAYLMFPWSNLLRHGMEGGHPRAMTFWYAGSEDITDLLCVTDAGLIMPYCPNVADQVAMVLKGRPILGLLGESDCVNQIIAGFGLGRAPLQENEPHYDLMLDDLVMPNTQGLTLHPLETAPIKTLRAWRAAYSVETLAVDKREAGKKARSDIDNYIANDSHRVLFDGDTPVAMTGFNATAPGVVQVGGVYTPPELRSRGYARVALALHLAEVRGQGVTRSILFAANEPAEKAYRAIGYQQIGRFSVVMFDDPQHV